MGCPYEGEVDPTKVNFVAQKLLDMGCYEISLGDTIGIGTPEKTYAMLDAVKVERGKLASHFHNTYNRAIQNLVISLSVRFKSSFLGRSIRDGLKRRWHRRLSLC